MNMEKEKNLTELANSYKFSCMGATNIARHSTLYKENAIPVIIKIYRDGKSEAECTCLVGETCEAATDKPNYGECPYVTKSRKG